MEIWQFIAEDNSLNADNFIDRLYASALQLAEFPLTGKLRPELGEQLYMFPVERYLLFYKRLAEQANGIVLVRVLHSARDIQL